MQVFYFLLLIGHLVWTVILTLIPDHAFPANYYYNLSSAIFFLLPLLYALIQYRRFRESRGSLLPWIITFTLLTVAQAIWSYYNFFTQTNVPFPGLGDVFWLSYYPLQVWVVINILRRFKLEWTFFDLATFFVLANIFILFTTHFLVTNLDLTAPVLTIILNFAYPTFDALLAALGLTLLRTPDHSQNRYLAFLVFGYLLITLADALFAYTNNYQTYWNGNFVDFLFVLAHFFIALAVYYLPRSESQTA